MIPVAIGDLQDGGSQIQIAQSLCNISLFEIK